MRISDWSSDVCSSDLQAQEAAPGDQGPPLQPSASHQERLTMRNQQDVASMSCPVDGTGLVMSERQGIEIDYCPTCRGVWLDRGELDKIIERSTATAYGPPADRSRYQDSDYRERQQHKTKTNRKSVV